MLFWLKNEGKQVACIDVN